MQKRATCVRCGRKRNRKYLHTTYENGRTVWACRNCDEKVKHDRGYEERPVQPSNQTSLFNPYINILSSNEKKLN